MRAGSWFGAKCLDQREGDSTGQMVIWNWWSRQTSVGGKSDETESP
jgi:hypothetical protein